MSTVKLARKRVAESDPRVQAFKDSLWKTWQAWRKHVADNERRGKPNVYENAPPIMDDNARLILADLLAENGDPREAIVRGHKEKDTYTREGEDQPRPLSFRNFGRHPETIHKSKLFWYDALGTDRYPTPQYELPIDPASREGLASWNFDGDLIHPGGDTRENLGNKIGDSRYVPSVVWRHAGVTTSRRGWGTGRDIEHPVMFHGAVTIPEYFAIADTMPEKKRKEWEAYAEHRGWKRPAGEPTKLARIDGTAAGVGQLASNTHAVRLKLLKHILTEARLAPSDVRAALAASKSGLRPSVLAAIQGAVSPEHAQYAAAWYGLLSGEPRLTVFHPGEGEDLLHVLDTDHPSDLVGEYLRKSGVDQFAVERRGAGSRAYVTNPLGKMDVSPIVRGLNARHSTVRGVATRLGAGEGSDSRADARAAYRTAIQDFERSATGSAGSDSTGPAD